MRKLFVDTWGLLTDTPLYALVAVKRAEGLRHQTGRGCPRVPAVLGGLITMNERTAVYELLNSQLIAIFDELLAKRPDLLEEIPEGAVVVRVREGGL